MITISKEAVLQIKEFGGTMKEVFETLAEALDASRTALEASADVQAATEARFDEPGGRKLSREETKPALPHAEEHINELNRIIMERDAKIEYLEASLRDRKTAVDNLSSLNLKKVEEVHMLRHEIDALLILWNSFNEKASWEKVKALLNAVEMLAGFKK